jgi:hypothetical protein
MLGVIAVHRCASLDENGAKMAQKIDPWATLKLIAKFGKPMKKIGL